MPFEASAATANVRGGRINALPFFFFFFEGEKGTIADRRGGHTKCGQFHEN